jgi:hypothetical protein
MMSRISSDQGPPPPPAPPPTLPMFEFDYDDEDDGMEEDPELVAMNE